jgi:hypothetical protein
MFEAASVPDRWHHSSKRLAVEWVHDVWYKQRDVTDTFVVEKE